jgi:hypothetical protein
MGFDSAATAGEETPDDWADGRSARYRDVTTADGDLIVYDVDEEDAWIQADRYDSLDACA